MNNQIQGLSIHAEVHGTGGAESRTSCLSTGGGSRVTILESPKSVKLLIFSLHNDLSFKKSAASAAMQLSRLFKN